MGLVDTDTCFLFEWNEHRQLLQASDLIIMSTLTASYAEWRWQNNNNNNNLLLYIYIFIFHKWKSNNCKITASLQKLFLN